jgi:hypothetical protein
MLHDPRKSEARRKEAARRALNRPVIVPPLPVSDLEERKNAAVLAWFAKLFDFYEIDPNGATRWEQLAWRLAFDRFPNFSIAGKSNVGTPGTKDAIMKLFYTFLPYERSTGAVQNIRIFSPSIGPLAPLAASRRPIPSKVPCCALADSTTPTAPARNC